MPRHRKHQEHEAPPTNRVTLYVAVIAGVLVMVELLLALKVGEGAWPEWLVTARGQILGLLGLGLLAAVCALPILLEANKRPRHLSGPGHNPEQGPGPTHLSDK